MDTFTDDAHNFLGTEHAHGVVKRPAAAVLTRRIRQKQSEPTLNDNALEAADSADVRPDQNLAGGQLFLTRSALWRHLEGVYNFPAEVLSALFQALAEWFNDSCAVRLFEEPWLCGINDRRYGFCSFLF